MCFLHELLMSFTNLDDDDMAGKHFIENATETLSLTRRSVEEQKKPTQYTLTSNLTLGTPIMVSL